MTTTEIKTIRDRANDNVCQRHPARPKRPNLKERKS